MRLRQIIRQLHRDDRGNLGVLMLLTIWALVLLVAIVWNTGEFATRKRHLQAAVDAAAHAGNTWTTRTTNLATSTNLVIAENGSAEAILRSVEPTRQTIQNRFDSERRRAIQLRQGSQKNSPERGVPDAEYFEELIGSAGWQGNGRGEQRMKELQALVPQVNAAAAKVLPLLPAQQAARLKQQIDDGIKQNVAALEYLVKDYVGGASGVGQPVGQWIANDVRPRLEDILATLDQEQSYLDQWQRQTAPAVNGKTPADLIAERDEIFAYQQRIRELTPDVIEEQRAKMAEFHKVDLTFATPGRPSDEEGSARIQAPIVEASSPGSKSITDSIRQRYPQATYDRFGSSSPQVTVDPINVNVDHAIIWHPGSGENAPPGITLMNQEFHGYFGVGGGEWGRVPCAPLNRYFNERISRDEQGLRKEPQQIDQARRQLGSRILPVTSPPSIPDLPRQFTQGTGPAATTMPLPPGRIPTIPTPNGLSQADTQAILELNERIGEYDTAMRIYVRDLRSLANSLQQMYQNLDNLSRTASQVFADNTWLGYVNQYRDFVLREIGWSKHFMVLSTYQLHDIPDWAVDGMRQDVEQRAYQILYNRNIGRVTNSARSRLEQWAFGILGNQQQRGQRNNARQQARQFANANAPGVAQYVVSRAARRIAQEVAQEWVQRPWPYELTPPENPVPPVAGVPDDDRKHHFTFVAAGLTNEDSSPKLLQGKAFNHASKPLAAFAQAETFTWMEYNEGYGAGDEFDRMTFYGHGDNGGSPRPWRLGTVGGWTWQPRLAFSDALNEAFRDGPEFRDFMSKGGVNGSDDNAIQTLTVH